MTDEPAVPPKNSEKLSTEEAKGATFTEAANFEGATFTNLADFADATFTNWINFHGATFTQEANFRGATFTQEANFRGATFTKWANLSGATFTDGANFRGASFTDGANFEHATFTQWVDFGGATFTNGAFFDRATFTKGADFGGATFTKGADFAAATFTGGADFVNSEMKSGTTFDNASFLRTPPLFDGATLHEGTTWFGVAWPRSPKTKEDARLTVRAYERLKLEMDKLKKHEDELNFFALELRARGVLAGQWSTSQGLAIGIYGCLCDYGRSYSRPVLLLGALSILGAVPFLVHFGLPGFRGSLALSIANTFGILGFRREFFPPSVITDLPWILKLVSGIQTVAGGVLFFLFGLGLRNRFRMR
jgi:uncharacterized protein YjbI with pentapeptide repeats